MLMVTCIAPVNIAVIKYWGKKDEDLIIPINDSISCTLNMDFMCAKTTVMASPNFKENKIWLNGKEESFENPRLIRCLDEIKRRTPSGSPSVEWKVHICSENNFPTAAGLASSAAGYACLVYALANLFKVKGDLSTIARLGSGSACRSVLDGWVQWHTGVREDGMDSVATQVASSSHWPEMSILILVVNENRKKYSSSLGMRQSTLTSEFLKYRAECIVPNRINKMIQAIESKDFETFATLTMKDSNNFHSACLDTYPPCIYMNDVSFAIVNFIHDYNNCKGSNKVAYTYDAGPNACLYLLEENVPEVLSAIKKVFPPLAETSFVTGIPVDEVSTFSPDLQQIIEKTKYPAGTLKYIIHTKAGEGPKIINNPNQFLLDENGLPKY